MQKPKPSVKNRIVPTVAKQVILGNELRILTKKYDMLSRAYNVLVTDHSELIDQYNLLDRNFQILLKHKFQNLMKELSTSTTIVDNTRK